MTDPTQLELTDYARQARRAPSLSASGGEGQGEVVLKERRDRIINYHTGCKASARQQVVYAFLAGAELITAKATLKHGEFMPFVESLPEDLPHRTATLYMRFAEALQPKLATVANFSLDTLRLTNGDLPADQKEILLQAIHETTTGSSLSDLYRELDIVKKPQAKETPSARRDLSPQEAAEAETATAIEFARNWLHLTRLFDEQVMAKLPHDLRNQVEEERLELGHKLSACRKQSKSEGRRSASPTPKKGSK